MTGQHWDALAKAVRERREQLRLPQDLTPQGGPGEITVRRIEKGETSAIRNRTRAQMEHALQWPDGLVDRILDGTATDDELAKRVVRGTVNATLPGLQASARGQVIRPKGIPSESQVGTPAVSGGYAEAGAIFEHASALVPLLTGRSPSTPATRAAVVSLLDVMSEIAGEMIQPGDTVTLDGEEYHP